MSKKLDKNRVVVISFDAGSNCFSINPNPVKIAVEKRLYFALQTVNKGDVEDGARFVSVFEDHAWACAKPVGDTDQLWYIDRKSQEATQVELGTYSYTIVVEYNGKEHRIDPTVIIDPPSTGP